MRNSSFENFWRSRGARTRLSEWGIRKALVGPAVSVRSIEATFACSTGLSRGSQVWGTYQENLLNRAVRSGELKKRPLRAKISFRAMRSSSFERPLRSSDISRRLSESGKMKSDCALGEEGTMGAGLTIGGKTLVVGRAVATGLAA